MGFKSGDYVKWIKSFLSAILLLLFCSCVTENNDIYSIYPKGTNLNMDIVRNSDAIFKTTSGVVLMYNLKTNVEEYNPHLLFFDTKNRLISACYFLSENIHNCTNNNITAYRNNERMQRESAFVHDVPDDIKVIYKDYKNEYPSGIIDDKGLLKSITYNKYTQSVNFYYENDKLDTISIIPLYKITYNYNEKEVIINDTFDNEMRQSKTFRSTKKQLDVLFKSILSDSL